MAKAKSKNPVNPIASSSHNPNQGMFPDPATNPNSNPPSTVAAAAATASSANAAASTTTNAAASATLKRPREGDEAAEAGTSTDGPAAKKRLKDSSDLIYRIVVPSRQIGKVIGKGGHRIKKIREDTKATIKIADAISRHEERVIIISSKDSENFFSDSKDFFSDAENAVHQIVSLILKDDAGEVEAAKVGAGHVAANAIRLLIAGSQAGGLIGVSGQNIENLRITSGATISVLSPNQLPPCASAHESDRVVQISGEIPAVLRAVVEIGCQLRGNPPKQVISISPTLNPAGFNRQAQQYVDPTSAEYVTLDLLVPENLVGGLIGRFGANISRIRNESGANIKVHGARGKQTQRQISLGGSAQQVALAKQRVDEYVYAEFMRQSGGQLQLHQAAGQLPQATLQLQQVASQQPIPDMSNTLYQGYGYAHSLYAHSNQDAGTLAAPLPVMYAPHPTTGAPGYYGHQPYPAPL